MTKLSDLLKDSIAAQGIQGISGLQGIQGYQGQGMQGLQGIQGHHGTQGFQGQGIQGIQGSQGIQGIQGSQGMQGEFNHLTAFISSGTTYARSLNDRTVDFLSLKDFGAIGDNIADDTIAINNWFAQLLLSGSIGYINPGTYKVTSPIIFDYVTKQYTGFTIMGAGVQKSILRSTVNNGDSAFSILCSGGTINTPAIGVYPKITGIGLLANIDGATLMIGNKDYSDQQNLIRLEIWAVNSNNGPDASIVEINSAYTLQLNMNGTIGNNSGNGPAGSALKLRKCSYGHFNVSFGGVATGPGSSPVGNSKGIYLTNSFNYANVFTCPDIEYIHTPIRIDNSQSYDNTFIGGLYGGTGPNVINATAGSNNLIINGSINGGPSYEYIFAKSGSKGVIYQKPKIQTAAPTTGDTINFNDGSTFLKITTSQLNDLTINLPKRPSDGMIIKISTWSTISNLTLVADTGDIIDINVNSLNAGEGISYEYYAPSSYWFKVY